MRPSSSLVDCMAQQPPMPPWVLHLHLRTRKYWPVQTHGRTIAERRGEEGCASSSSQGCGENDYLNITSLVHALHGSSLLESRVLCVGRSDDSPRAKTDVPFKLCSQGRVCPSIEFEFISTIMGQDFLVPIKPITRLVLKANSSSQIGASSLRINSRNTQPVSNT